MAQALNRILRLCMLDLSENDQNRQERKQEHDDSSSKINILTQEIDSWSKFEYALRGKQTHI